MIAYGIVVTPEREQRVAFSTPIQTDVSQIIVTGPKLRSGLEPRGPGWERGVCQSADNVLHKFAKGERDAETARQDAHRH